MARNWFDKVVDEMDSEECDSFVKAILKVMYEENGELNPEKDHGVDTIDEIYAVIETHNVTPDSDDTEGDDDEDGE